MTEVRTVAVIGAGIMGRGIAHAAALGGLSHHSRRSLLPNPCARPRLNPRQPRSSRGTRKSQRRRSQRRFRAHRYAGSVDEAARQADLVIEAVPRKWNQDEIFTMLDKICRPTTILPRIRPAQLTEIASVTYRAKMRRHALFQPVHKMKLLEIVCALETMPTPWRRRRVGKPCARKWS